MIGQFARVGSPLHAPADGNGGSNGVFVVRDPSRNSTPMLRTTFQAAKPVERKFSAGPWVLVRLVREWTKAISSVSSARCGIISETILPVWPRGLNSYCGRARLPAGPWNVTAGPPGSGLSSQATSSGFQSQVSSWLTAPAQKITTTFFAFAGKCGARGANGRAGSMAGAASRPSRRLRWTMRREPAEQFSPMFQKIAIATWAATAAQSFRSPTWVGLLRLVVSPCPS